MTSVYIHLPYCSKKCPYCDFNSYEKSSIPEARYLSALLKEIAAYSNLLDGGIYSVFFGGGTPSLFSPNSIEQIITALGRPKVETTLEANPASIHEPSSANKLHEFKTAGINRVSMGAQSFSDKKLKFLGRLHSSANSKQAIANIVKAGFKNFNLDLIFGCLDESFEEWTKELASALQFNPTHLSCYGLTIEPGTEFGRISKKGKTLTTDEDTFAKMYEFNQKELNSQGFEQYEISNFAAKQYQCQHNLNYWLGGQYLGLGAGAVSFVGGSRWRNHLSPEKYMKEIETNQKASLELEKLSQAQLDFEKLFLSLRTSEGAELKIVSKQSLKDPSLKGLVYVEEGKLKLSQKGFLFSDLVFEKLEPRSVNA